MKVVSLALATLLSSFIVSEASANLVTNGSFEIYAGGFGTDGSAQLLTTSAALTGWTIVGNEIAILRNGNSYGPTAAAGRKFLDLAGYTDTGFPKGISQTINGLVKGQNYDLSMELGVRNGLCGLLATCAGPIQVSASVGATGQTFNYSSLAPGNSWETFDLGFTATQSSELLTIRGVLVIPGNIFIGLDNVAVNRVVPLPASLWFLAAGLGGLALFARRPRTSHLAQQRFA